MTTVGAVWETEADREKEDLVMRRICGEPSRAFRLPKFSLVDFLVTENDSIKAFVEVKVRKEPLEQVKKYGGLMLKHRKIAELAYLSKVTNVRSYFVFAFESGLGDLLIADAAALHLVGLEECDPPPRGRDRGRPACDFETVAFLDWGVHVHLISQVFSRGDVKHPTPVWYTGRTG